MDLLCQNWPMKVSKGQHLKAERTCLNAAATMKCDKRSDLVISHIHVLLTSLGQHVPLKINVGFAKVWQKEIWRGWGVPQCHMKEFRTTLVL